MLNFSLEWKKQTVACMKLLIMLWGYVRDIHAASTKFLSCWLHHKLRLQRPMAASRPMLAVVKKVLNVWVYYAV